MKEMDYISKMVQETLQGASDRRGMGMQHPPSILQAYKNLQKRCIVIVNRAGDELEVPINWGPFKNNYQNEFLIESESDEFDFLPIISTFFQEDFFAIRIVVEDKFKDHSDRSAA